MDSGNELMLGPNKELVCPRGRSKGTITIELKEILRVEARQAEVQSLTKDKALELQKVFNESWRELKQNIALLKFERDEAEASLDEVRSDLIIDKVPGILKEKELGAAKDIRDAVVARQPEYRAARTVLNYLNAVVEFLEVKAKGFERAYQSARSVSDGQGAWWAKSLSRGGGAEPLQLPEASGTHDTHDTKQADDPYAGFGKPTY